MDCSKWFLAVLFALLCWQGFGFERPTNAVQDVCSSSDKTCEWVKWKNSKVIVSGTLGQEPHIYCLKRVEGILPGLRNIWTKFRVSLVVSKVGNLTLQPGNSSAAIRQVEDSTFWSGLLMTSKDKKLTQLEFNPFEGGCVGVASLKGNKAHEYQVEFRQELSLLHLMLIVVGVALFMNASRCCRNMAFYYAGGIFIGMVASVLFLLYVFSKLIPKKNLWGLGVVVGGWSLAGYFITWFLNQGLEFMLENWIFISIYIVLAGLVSFGVLYRFGPAHDRTLQLLQWSTQLLALYLVAWGFPTWGMSLVAMAMLLVWYNIPVMMCALLSSIFWRIIFCFKPLRRLFEKRVKKRLLTLDEYEHQGKVETEAALNELQEYCRYSRKFWKHKLNKLEDKQQFLDFIAGKDHVSEEEKDEHWKEFAFLPESSGEEDTDVSAVASEDITPTRRSFHSSNSSLSSPSLTPSSSPQQKQPRHRRLHFI